MEQKRLHNYTEAFLQVNNLKEKAMCKSDVFKKILEFVTNETEVDANLILSDKRTAEIVDARYIVVKLLHDAGFYNQTIAKLIHHTEKSVSIILYNFSDRIKHNKFFRITYETIKNKVGNK